MTLDFSTMTPNIFHWGSQMTPEIVPLAETLPLSFFLYGAQLEYH